MTQLKRHSRSIWAGTVFIISCILIACLRSHTFQEPLEADEAILAIIAQDWIDGGKPYVTLWENKPIGSYVIYRLAIAAFGYNELAPKLFAMFSMGLTAVGLIFILLREQQSILKIGLLLILWSLITCLPSCYANGANIEIFLLPLIILSYILSEKFRETGAEKYFWLIFAVLTLSFLVKQVTLPYFAIPFLIRFKSQWHDRKHFFFKIAGVSGLILIVHITVYGFFGYSPTDLVQQFKQNAGHVIHDVDNSGFRFLKSLLQIPFDHSVGVLTIPILAGYAVAIKNLVRPKPTFELTFTYFFIATAIAIALPGANYPHYYILLLPFVILGMSTFCDYFRFRWQVFSLIAVTAYVMSSIYTDYLKIHPNKISYVKYDNNNWFVRDRFIGNELRNKGMTGKRVYIDGSHPGIFFYSRNKPANKFFVAWYYTTMGITTWDDVFMELQAAPPGLCVFLNPISSQMESWIKQNYVWKDSIAGSNVFVRR